MLLEIGKKGTGFRYSSKWLAQISRDKYGRSRQVGWSSVTYQTNRSLNIPPRNHRGLNFWKIFVQIPHSRGRKAVQIPHHRSIPGDQMPPLPGNFLVASDRSCVCHWFKLRLDWYIITHQHGGRNICKHLDFTLVI